MKAIRIITVVLLMFIIIPYDLIILFIDDLMEERAKRKWLKRNSR